ncbi:hypothetical protein LWI29_000625 [Acer saccharum]|uniref:Uncharacterized protein n=1 Tax=Acer saccharum TaxID=4024 RepID=A0AA39VEV3_ACESA|nr:hypothetical protein LWI29_000625 [Acer saccharum]
MGPVVISVKFAGTQIEYNVLEPESYTLAALWADVYVMSYSNFPDPNEKFTTEAILPWNRQHRLIEDDRDLQDIFMVAGVDPEVLVNSEPHIPVDSYSCNNDVDTTSNNNSDDVVGNEANGNQHEVESDINTDDEQLSNAASFNGDLYAIFEDNSDDESQTKPYVPKPGKPFRVADDGKALPQATQASQAAQTYQGAPISQPITHNAPLYSTAMLSQPCQSKSNPSTVAGLDVDWCGGFASSCVYCVAHWVTFGEASGTYWVGFGAGSCAFYVARWAIFGEASGGAAICVVCGEDRCMGELAVCEGEGGGAVAVAVAIALAPESGSVICRGISCAAGEWA